MNDGYKPTCHLRVVRGVEYMSDDFARHVDRLQQLWVSSYEGEDEEWRDVEIVVER